MSAPAAPPSHCTTPPTQCFHPFPFATPFPPKLFHRIANKIQVLATAGIIFKRKAKLLID